MKQRHLTLLFAIVAGAIFLILFYFLANRPSAKLVKSEDEKLVQANLALATSASIASPSPPPPNPNLLPPEDPVRRWDRLFSNRVNFYGKVVDENNDSVTGASIRYSVPSNLAQIGKGTVQGPITDANGLFSITGKTGAGITVFATHPSYYNTDRSYGQFSYTENTERNPTRDKPAVFVLQKKGVSEPMLRIKQVKSVPKDGRQLQIGLSKKGAAEINLSVWTSSPLEPSKLNAPFAWKMRLSVPGGGLMANNDPYLFQAPEGEYAPEIEFEMPVVGINGKWGSDFKQTYFVKLSNGHFARMRFKMIAGGGHFAVVESYYNPQPGSRNLEYDPTNSVQTP